MLKSKISAAIVFQFLFFFICAFYIVFYMPYGFEDTDTGYIFGTSWSIYNGEIPHRDFIYTRPAVPAFFHTIFLFISETYGYIIDRSFFYIQIFIYSYLGSKILCNTFSITSKETLYFIAILGAVISIHNYPPMAWNTVDGVFFCTIGLYLLLHEKSRLLYLFLGAIFIVLGMFSKQSFYFMPLFICLYFLLRKDYFRLKYFAFFGLIGGLMYVGIKYLNGSLEPFLNQTFQRTPTSALVDAGIKSYYLALKFNIIYVTLLLIGIWVASKYLGKKYTYLILNVGVVVLISFLFIRHSGNWSTIEHLFQLLLIVASAYSLYMLRKDKRFLVLILLITLSWSASISNGYRTPIHFSLPLIFALYIFFFSEVPKQISFLFSSIILTLYLVTFYLGYQTIYRDSNRDKLIYEMGDVFPQLTFIKSDHDTFEKYKELKKLAAKYPVFTAIPSVTHAHYLTKTINPIGIDWPLDVEINNQSKSLVDQLADKNAYVFLEKKEYSQYELDSYEIKSIIEKDWVLVEKGTQFDVYRAR
ncbi:hypothetical protein ATE92_1790 [Ulvibacter sp. MAR_2010_11]|uniref:hypothetical protein n=1 Tax=Ulvibacter sp. MAR_2010_11 TaxID=1250229 RepID=UPI000CAD3298|nr:hypothetical protein [Ulvibacter sp. MAR_2010_11]PKA83630.1 hypothetical protein ATE92_1790 [Ulvibacter sp. MAR_2010_11]